MTRLILLLLATGCGPRPVSDTGDFDGDGLAGDADCNDVDPDIGGTTFYPDADGDGFGDDALATVSCLPPEDMVLEGGDCDDGSAAIHPVASERCDGVDNDCDGLLDDADDMDSAYLVAFSPDEDGDGVGDGSTVVEACEAPEGFAAAADGVDCDDQNANVAPGLPEYCDGLDNDCDEDTRDEEVVTFVDIDGVHTDLTDVFAAGTASDAHDFESWDSGTLRLCDGVYYANLLVSHDLDIEALSGARVELHGDATASVITVPSSGGATVSVKGLSLSDGEAEEGGCINADSASLTLSAVELSDCVATAAGGALAATRSDVLLDDVLIWTSEAPRGGGIYLEHSTLLGADLLVGFNDASDGGGLYLDGDSAVSGDAVEVFGNRADDGGGLFIDGGVATVSSVRVDGNSAEASGGGLYVAEGVELTLDGLEVLHNEGVGDSGAGGGLYLAAESASLTGLTIEDNEHPVSGGGLAFQGEVLSIEDSVLHDNRSVDGGAAALTGEVTADAVELSGNIATGSGGAIHGDAVTLVAAELLVHGNSASADGGGIALTGEGAVEITDSALSDNDGDSGGAVFLDAGALVVRDCTFTDNQASHGADLSLWGGSATVSADTFSGGEATDSGGAIFALQVEELTLEELSFTGSTATWGGALYLDDTTVVAEGLSCSQTSSEYSGGCLALSDGDFSLTDVTITEAVAAGSGGGIYSSATLSLVDVTITDSEATQGGGLYVYDSATLDGLVLTGNTAEYGGGAWVSGDLTWVDDSASQTSRLTDNEATADGGGLYLESWRGASAVEELLIEDNVAAGDGGGVWAGAWEATELGSCVFSDNTAGGYGGGLYVTGEQLAVEQGTFGSNTATAGGAIALEGLESDADVTIDESSYSGNDPDDVFHVDAETSSSNSSMRCDADGCSGGAS